MCNFTTFEEFDRLIAERKAEYFAKNRFAVEAPGAGLDWLTREEREVHHQIRLSLPSAAEEMASASERIKARIALRRKT